MSSSNLTPQTLTAFQQLARQISGQANHQLLSAFQSSSMPLAIQSTENFAKMYKSMMPNSLEQSGFRTAFKELSAYQSSIAAIAFKSSFAATNFSNVLKQSGAFDSLVRTNAFGAAATASIRPLMKSMSQQYATMLTTSYSVPTSALPDTSFLSDVVTQIMGNLSNGFISADVIRAAEELTAATVPEFAKTVDEAASGQPEMLDRVFAQSWKILTYIFTLFIWATVTGILEAESFEQGIKDFLEAVVAERSSEYLTKHRPFQEDDSK